MKPQKRTDPTGEKTEAQMQKQEKKKVEMKAVKKGNESGEKEYLIRRE